MVKRGLFVLALLLVPASVLLAGCGEQDASSRFTPGNLRDVASTFPGATQVTNEDGIAIPERMEQVMGSLKDVRWKHYRIENTVPEAILDWYDVLLTGTGWERAQYLAPGAVLFLKGGDTRLAVYAAEGSGGVDLVLAEGTE